MDAPEKQRRLLKREPVKLLPARWRLIVILTDTPLPGEGYLSKDEIQASFEDSVDLPAGVSFEIGTIEKAAQGSQGS